MRPLDWIVLASCLALVVGYGTWRGRGSNTVNKYMLAGNSMPWYAIAFSIMATQASAITFISTTGQSYVDGMRFVQFYFGLPLAMIILSVTLVPLFHRAKVYTAYEYLEQRFDAKTRALASVIFLIERGLAIGISLYALAIVLSIILHWPDRITILIVGALALLYTTLGGVVAVTWTEFPQMIVMTFGLLAAFGTALWLLPQGVTPLGAVKVAAAAGKLHMLVPQFSWSDRYNIWSGILGGMFLALAYFGCDQSQVQRYLTGKSLKDSRMSLLFNGVAKIPLQMFILFIGAIVFSFYNFEKPPVVFDQISLRQIEASANYQQVIQRYDIAFEHRRTAAMQLAQSNPRSFDPPSAATDEYQHAEKEFDAARADAIDVAKKANGGAFNDTNYIFLTFVTRYLPAGIVGLIIATIMGAAMASVSSEINSLATVTVIDIYKRHFRKNASDHHYLRAAKIATLFWGVYAVTTAGFGRNLGSLIEAVNILGSLFYGGLLGVFVLAAVKRVTGNGAFFGVIAGELAIFAAAAFTKISFLWYNVIGCLVVIIVGVGISILEPASTSIPLEAGDDSTPSGDHESTHTSGQRGTRI
jgi:Na+/proline symporter